LLVVRERSSLFCSTDFGDVKVKHYLTCIKIITRPKDRLGYYEYYMDTRKRQFFLFPSREPDLFIAALTRIARGVNPSGWIITRPSEKEVGLKIDPVKDFVFYRLDDALLFFPNRQLKAEWVEYNLSSQRISEPSPPITIGGIKVLDMTCKFADE